MHLERCQFDKLAVVINNLFLSFFLVKEKLLKGLLCLLSTD